MQDLWIWILAAWLPVAGVVVALCIYDLTGGEEVWPQAEAQPPQAAGNDAAYRKSLDP